MNMRSVIVLSTLIAGTALAGPPRYSITELAPTDSGDSSWGWSVHADGRVAGARTRAKTQTVGTVWTMDSVTDYGPYDNAEHAWATALGSDEAVFGVSRSSLLFANPLTVWVSTPDLAPALLNYLPQYAFNATADVNRFNQTVGWTYTGASVGQEQVRRAFTVLVDGTLRDPVLIPTLGGWANWANAINDQAMVVGGSLTGDGPLRAYLWSPARLQPLGTLGGPASEAIDINNSGLIVGWAMNASGARRAFLSDGGAMTDLGTLGGATAEARGINDAGSIVGESWTSEGGVRAFVIHGSIMYDLHDLTPAAQGWRLVRAEDISPSGVIVGWGTRLVDGERRTRGFRLDPLCAADLDGDGTVEFADYLTYLNLYAGADPRADLNDDGVVDFGDYLEFLNHYDSGC